MIGSGTSTQTTQTVAVTLKSLAYLGFFSGPLSLGLFPFGVPHLASLGLASLGFFLLWAFSQVASLGLASLGFLLLWAFPQAAAFGLHL